MTKEQLANHITDSYIDKLSLSESNKTDLLYEVKAEDLLSLMKSLRDDEALRFDFLCNMGGNDTRERFEVVYSLASIALKHRLDIKVVIPYELPQIESLTSVWPAVDWYERELEELYGIKVANHPDMKPLLLPENWNEGYPMRKDWDAPDFKRMPEM